MKSYPKIAILMATYNGQEWLASQLKSILNQSDVEVTLFVSDDLSTDNTLNDINELAKRNSCIKVLPSNQRLGSAGKNFYKLILSADLAGYDYVAFADQDDIWEQDKLIRHVKLMQQYGVDGVSSNVLAFWPDGKTKLIHKAQHQRNLDYLFESAGPGCTFLMSTWLVGEVKRLLNDPKNIASEVALHDWLVYAVCRASGKKWLIDSKSSLQYRQHGKNVVGANSGLRAKLTRLQKVFNGWYKGEVLKVLTVSYLLSNDPKLLTISKLLEKSDLLSRFKVLRFIPQARRKLSDRISLALMIIFGLF